jgi:hypothetical protein
VRVQLIRVLEGRRATRAVTPLLALAAEGEPRVAVAALRAVSALATAQSTPSLITLVKAAADDAVRRAAERALVDLARRTGTVDEAGRLVRAEFESASHSAVREAWIRVLTAWGYGPALPLLLGALDDPNERVGLAAAEELGRWPDPAPVESLLRAADQGSSEAERRRALRSAVQLATVAAEEDQRPPAAIAAWLKRAGALAGSVEEKRLIVSALARVKAIEGFRLLEAYAADPAVREEAVVAMIQVAPAFSGHRDAGAVRAALEKVAAGATDARVREQAAKAAQGLSVKR